MKTSLYTLSAAEIAQKLGLEKKFQGKQIKAWLARGVFEFELMTDLPLKLRNRLSAEFGSGCSSCVVANNVDETGAVKLGVQLSDSQVVECVLLITKDGKRTACISSQSGCAMLCRFCRTGTMRLRRNLASFEIIEQFIHLMRLGEKPESIVFMGMGEPLANIDNVLKAIAYFHDPEGINLSHRRMTVSTCGLVPGLKKLIAADVPVKLAVSLTVADEIKRSSLMPVNNSFPLKTLKPVLVEYQKHYGRRITLECCLISGVNTTESDAKKLAAFTAGLDTVVNLIPFNEAAELEFRTPDEAELEKFCAALDKAGVAYTRRFSRGRGVNGACGQLAVKFSADFAED